MLRFEVMSTELLSWYFDRLCSFVREPMTSAERAAERAERRRIAHILADRMAVDLEKSK
jgi:hypothetical protein